MDDPVNARLAFTAKDLTGFKFMRVILPMLGRLHEQGCKRDKAHHRTLFFDNYCALMLLYFFNPIVKSMGGIVQASTLEKVQKELGVSPTSKASFSEASAVFEVDLLQEIVSELAGQVNVMTHDGRLRDNSSIHELVENRPLSAQAKAVGILSDQVVKLGSDPKYKELKQPLRIIRIACKKHKKRAHTGRGGPEQDEFLLIATDLLDLPAEVIALIYRSRWAVEIFFRFFKQVLGCRHLLSHRENGIKIQVFMAIIASLLIALCTGRKPTLRTVEMMQFYFSGWATEKEVEAHIAKLKKQPE
jgi:hypothetical protein